VTDWKIRKLVKNHGRPEVVALKATMARVIIFTAKDDDEIAKRTSRNVTVELWLDGKINLKAITAESITVPKKSKPKTPYIS